MNKYYLSSKNSRILSLLITLVFLLSMYLVVAVLDISIGVKIALVVTIVLLDILYLTLMFTTKIFVDTQNKSIKIRFVRLFKISFDQIHHAEASLVKSEQRENYVILFSDKAGNVILEIPTLFVKKGEKELDNIIFELNLVFDYKN